MEHIMMVEFMLHGVDMVALYDDRDFNGQPSNDVIDFAIMMPYHHKDIVIMTKEQHNTVYRGMKEK